jgi:6-phosphogluconolactonase
MIKRVVSMAALGLSWLVGSAAVTALGLTAPAAAAVPVVFTMDNSAGANSLVVFQGGPDGSLGPPQMVQTGGAGTGAGLGSQGAIALSGDGQWLLVVNAGSNDVSVFSVRRSEPALRTRVPSGGTMPISVTEHRGTVFVLNAGGTPNIAGFTLHRDGSLQSIPGATVPLAGTGPAQVSFSPDGHSVIVTDKFSNTIEVFTFNRGELRGPEVHASAGVQPFGFAVDRRGILIVTEAFGGMPGASAVSSYRVGDEGSLELITASLGTTQTAACWAVVTRNGKYAYTANTGSSSITSIGVNRDGSLELLAPVAGQTPPGTATIDLALDRGSRFLYALASGTISSFRVRADGTLFATGTVVGLASSTVGIVAK